MIDENVIETLVKEISEGKINKDSVADILIEFSTENGKKRISLEEIISNFHSISEDTLVTIIREEIEKNKEELLKRRDKAFNILMARVMGRVRGKAEGKLVAELIRKEVDNLLR